MICAETATHPVPKLAAGSVYWDDASDHTYRRGETAVLPCLKRRVPRWAPAAQWLLLAVGVALVAGDAQAGTVNAANCTRTAVSNAVAAANNGDTVVIPACPGGISWTTKLVITKGITLQGQGIGVTVLIDNVPKGNASCGNAEPMLEFDVNAPNNFRLTGLTIRGGVADIGCNPGHLGLGGTSKAFRVDHVRFENQQTSAIRTGGDLWGVIDHCQFQGDNKQGVIIDHENWGGRSYGDGSWDDLSYFGTEKAIYIEDCTFIDPSPVGSGAMDMFSGGRVVFRYNTGVGFMGGHGTESSGRRRGMRTYEIYNNTFTAPAGGAFTAIFLRGGTGVIHNNTFLGAYTDIVQAANFRDDDTFSPWGQCNGSSSFDQNQGGQSGYACLDQVGRGTGNLISGDTPTPVAWPQQALEPLYVWNNTLNGSSNNVVGGDSVHIQQNRDYFQGTLKPGYTPFTYPHPLTTGAGAPEPPQSLGATVR